MTAKDPAARLAAQADTIKRYQARLAELREERDAARAEADMNAKDAIHWRAMYVGADAEADALRAALSTAKGLMAEVVAIFPPADPDEGGGTDLSNVIKNFLEDEALAPRRPEAEEECPSCGSASWNSKPPHCDDAWHKPPSPSPEPRKGA